MVFHKSRQGFISFSARGQLLQKTSLRARAENKPVLFSALLLSLLVLCVLSGCEFKQKPEEGPDYLVLVNKTHLISESYIRSVTLREVPDVYGDVCRMEAQTLDAYNALRDALAAKGIEIGVDFSYRSVEEQEEIMRDFTEKYGEEYAKRTVAVPGTSEHHTGLAVDIVPKVDGEWVSENEDMLKETEIFRVIHETLPDYGFILRYPEGKEAITGYDYEPWHLRFVGKEAAKEIMDAGLTLEEYTEQKNAG